MPSKFVEENINAIDQSYQLRYKAKLGMAIEDYLQWMRLHIRSKWRLNHFFHGESGRERVMNLQSIMNNPSHSFNFIVESVATVIRASGYTEHSFNRFLYQRMTDDIVIGVKPGVTINDFYARRKKHWDEQLAANNSSQTLEVYSFMGLTKGVSLIYEDEQARQEYESRGNNMQAGRWADQNMLMQSTYSSGCDDHHHHHSH
jgi:hypothetical protein